MQDPPPRTPPATFTPRFTLSLLYLAVFFLGFSLLVVAPELAAFEAPADPEQAEAVQAEIRETIRRVYAPRMPFAFGLAVIALFVCAWRGWLPGIRPPEGAR